MDSSHDLSLGMGHYTILRRKWSQLTDFLWMLCFRMFIARTNKPSKNWVCVNTYRYILVGWTSIYQLFWGSLGTRVLTHPQWGMKSKCNDNSKMLHETIRRRSLATAAICQRYSTWRTSQMFKDVPFPFSCHQGNDLQQDAWNHYAGGG